MRRRMKMTEKFDVKWFVLLRVLPIIASQNEGLPPPPLLITVGIICTIVLRCRSSFLSFPGVPTVLLVRLRPPSCVNMVAVLLAFEDGVFYCFVEIVGCF